MTANNKRLRTISVEECPKCLSNQVAIYDSRLIEGERIRKRKCLECDARWFTKEVRI